MTSFIPNIVPYYYPDSTNRLGNKFATFQTTSTGTVTFVLRGTTGVPITFHWGDGVSTTLSLQGASTDVTFSHNYGGAVGTKLITVVGDYLAIFQVTAQSAGLTDISGISKFTAINERVNVSTNALTNISYLSMLKSAIYFFLMYNTSLSDISPLQGLTALKRIQIDHTNVWDLAALATIPNMENISIYNLYTLLTDLSPIQGLTKLKYLNLINDYYVYPDEGFSWPLFLSTASLNLSDNYLTTEEIDRVLHDCVTSNQLNITINVGGTLDKERTASSDTDKATLLSRGNTVTVKEPNVSLVTTASTAKTATFQGTLNATITISPGDGGASDVVTLQGVGVDVVWTHTYSGTSSKTIKITGDFSSVTSMDFNNWPISETWGLRNFTALTNVNLSNCGLSAISVDQALRDLANSDLHSATINIGGNKTRKWRSDSAMLVHTANGNTVTLVADKDSIAVEGDSIFLSTSWPQYMDNIIWNASEVTYFSVGGGNFGDWPNSEIQRYCRRVKPYGAASGKTGYLFLGGGTNDIAGGRTGLQLIADLERYYTLAKQTFDHLCVFHILPRSSFNTTQEAYRVQVNSWITAHPELYDTLVTIPTELLDSTNLTYYSDGTHPTELGQQILAAAVESAMEWT